MHTPGGSATELPCKLCATLTSSHALHCCYNLTAHHFCQHRGNVFSESRLIANLFGHAVVGSYCSNMPTISQLLQTTIAWQTPQTTCQSISARGKCRQSRRADATTRATCSRSNSRRLRASHSLKHPVQCLYDILTVIKFVYTLLA